MSKYDTLTSRLERKRQAQNQLEGLVQENSNVAVRLGAARSKQIDLRQQVNSLQSTVDNDKAKGKSSNYEGRLQSADSDYRRCSEEVTWLEKRQLEIAEEKLQLQRLIQECDSGAGVAEVKAHQAVLAEAQAEVERLRSLIAEQEEALASASTDADERLEELQECRETVLAGIALGETQQGELDALDKEIAAILEDTDGSQRKSLEQYRHASQTINGLRTRLQPAEESLAEVEALTVQVLEQFLISQADEISAAYTEQAKAIGESFARIKALDEILMTKTGRKSMTFIPGTWYRLYVPALPGHPLEGVADGEAFKADAHNYPAQVQAEIERMQDMGLTTFF